MKSLINQGGYIALISAILISVSLLTLVIAVSSEGFYSRFNVLESEQKEISTYLAESCLQTAILEIAQDSNYNDDPIIIPVGDDLECEIVSVDAGTFPSTRLVRTQGIIGDAYTNLEVEIGASPTYEIVSWIELPELP